MSDIAILWWITLAIAFGAGFGLGHLRGQCVGIAWCSAIDKKFAPIEKVLSARSATVLDREAK